MFLYTKIRTHAFYKKARKIINKFKNMPLSEAAAATIAAGTAAAGQIGSGFLGLIGQKKREKRAMANTRELMGIQFKNQKELDKYGQQLQLETWEKTNYPAQMAMLKEAGLNPGLMYGQAGSGGVTGSQVGGSAASGNAPAPQPWPLDIGSAMMMAAQIKLMKAQAKKTEAEADVIVETGIKKAESEIAKIISETTNEGLKGRLLSIQSDIADIDKACKPYQIEASINNVIEQTKQMKIANDLTEAQFNYLVDEVRYKAVGAHLNNQLTQAKISLTDTEKQSIITSIVQKWTELGLKEREVSVSEKNQIVNQFEAEIRAEYPSIGQAAGSVLKKALDSLETIEKGFWNLITGGKVKITYNEDKVNYK